MKLKNDPVKLSYENNVDFTGGAQSVDIVVCDSGALCDFTTITVFLEDVAEGQYMPPGTADYTANPPTLQASIDSLAPLATEVQPEIEVKDYDDSEELQYSINGGQVAYGPDGTTVVDANSNYFSLNFTSSNNGMNALIAAMSIPNSDVLSRVELTVRVTDGVFNFDLRMVIMIRYNNQAPVFSLPPEVMVREDETGCFLSLSAPEYMSDADSWQTHVYAFVNPGNVVLSTFQMDPNTGSVSVYVQFIMHIFHLNFLCLSDLCEIGCFCIRS
jgi:hypothetical protein